MVSRSSVGFGSTYYNGALDFGVTGTSGIPNRKLYSVAGNMAGTALGSAGQVAMVSAGADLDAAETALFYGHIRTYMTAVGVP